MIHVEIKKNTTHRVRNCILSLLLLVGFLCLILLGVQEVSSRAGEEQLHALDQAIRHATIQCYAIEGRYPPSVAYLEEHYGIFIDHEKYYVFYSGFASNIMPDITVIPAN